MNKKCHDIKSWHFCDPAGAQTQNLQNRNLTLYSIELRGPERSPDRTGGAASAKEVLPPTIS